MTAVGNIRTYAAFARNLSQRHSHHARHVRSVGMVLRMRGAAANHIWHQTKQYLGLNVGLRVPVTLRQDMQTTTATTWYGATTMITRINPMTRVVEPRTSLRTHRETLIGPLSRQVLHETLTRRTETVRLTERTRVQTTSPHFASVDRHRRPVAVPMAIKAAPAAGAPVPPPLPAATAFPGWEPAGPAQIASTVRPHAVTSSATDIHQLTDRVVAAIDQRLIAHRERTGRGWA